MLDELTQMEAVERLSNQRVKARSRTPIFTGLTGSAIAGMGERAGDLLETLTNNLRRTSKPLFEGTALLEESDLELVSLIRREIAAQGASFIDSANSLFSRSRLKANRSITKGSTKCRLGVTVFYFQDDIEGAAVSKNEKTFGRRKNLQRRRRPTNGKRKTAVMGRSVVKVQL